MTVLVKNLTINGTEKEAKGTLLFVKKADKIYNEPNAEGHKQGGFSNIYTGLINQEAGALSAFWSCALPGYKEDVIDNALNDAIAQYGWNPLFRGAIDVLEHDLILKGQTEIFWGKMDMALGRQKNEEEKAELEQSIQTMKELKEEFMRPAYEQTDQPA